MRFTFQRKSTGRRAKEAQEKKTKKKKKRKANSTTVNGTHRNHVRWRERDGGGHAGGDGDGKPSHIDTHATKTSAYICMY